MRQPVLSFGDAQKYMNLCMQQILACETHKQQQKLCVPYNSSVGHACNM